MCAPAKVMSQLLECEHVSEKRAMFLNVRLPKSRCKYLGVQKGLPWNRQGSQRKCHPLMILA
eukprot:1099001-Pelagomonas_calceolata.AAC.1